MFACLLTYDDNLLIQLLIDTQYRPYSSQAGEMNVQFQTLIVWRDLLLIDEVRGWMWNDGLNCSRGVQLFLLLRRRGYPWRCCHDSHIAFLSVCCWLGYERFFPMWRTSLIRMLQCDVRNVSMFIWGPGHDRSWLNIRYVYQGVFRMWSASVVCLLWCDICMLTMFLHHWRQRLVVFGMWGWRPGCGSSQLSIRYTVVVMHTSVCISFRQVGNLHPKCSFSINKGATWCWNITFSAYDCFPVHWDGHCLCP